MLRSLGKTGILGGIIVERWCRVGRRYKGSTEWAANRKERGQQEKWTKRELRGQRRSTSVKFYRFIWCFDRDFKLEQIPVKIVFYHSESMANVWQTKSGDDSGITDVISHLTI